MEPPARLVWIDVARGIAITLVVAHHSIQFLDGNGWSVGPLPAISALLATFRMPLFFLVSGVLASGIIARASFSVLFWRRMALLLYIYALWCLIRYAWFLWVPWPFDPAVSPLGDLTTALILPWSGLWFVYGLALYMALAWLMRRLPWWVQLAAGFVVSGLFATGVLQIGAVYTWRSIGTYFVFFLLGSLASSRIRALAGRLTIPWALLVAGVFLIGCVVFALGPLHALVGYLVSFAGAAFGVALAVTLARWGVAARAVGFLGQRTLPIYVTHVLVVSLLAWVVPTDLVPAVIAVLLLIAISITVSVLLGELLGRVGGVYSLPAPVGRFARTRSAPAT